MTKATHLIAVTATLLGCLITTSEAQECGFFFLNGTNTHPNANSSTQTITSFIEETALPDSDILTLTVKPSTANVTCSTESGYVKYSFNYPTVTLKVNGSWTTAYDQGLFIDNMPLGLCSLYCTPSSLKPDRNIVNLVEITHVNDLAPQFNEDTLDVTIDETVQPGVDILSRSDKLLYAFDMDYNTDGSDARIAFSVDNSKFAVLPSFQMSYFTAKGVERISYIPRVGLSAPWSRQDNTSVTFNLIATDQGKPQNKKSIPITVQILQVDLEDPKFNKDYYTAIITSSTEAGEVLLVSPEPIKAVDGDDAINEEILYRIENSDSLDLELIPKDGGVEVLLKSAVVPSEKKMAYVVIEAYEKSNRDRFDRVVLAVELPLRVETTTTGTPETCPPCPTTTSTTPTTTTTTSPATCPTVTCPTTTCPTTTCPTTTCPPCTPPTVTCPICECSTISASTCTECPTCPSSPADCVATTLSQGNSTSSTASPSPSSTFPAQSTIVTLSSTSTSTEIPSSSSGTCPPCPTCTSSDMPSTTSSSSLSTTQMGNASTSCPVVSCPPITEATQTPSNCPVVTCPTSTQANNIPTCPTCAPCVPTCPSTSVSSCPPCDLSSTSKTVTDLTTQQVQTTSPSTPLRPTVTFEKEQYASEIIENSPAGTFIAVVKAVSSDGNTDIKYTLKQGENSQYFEIDEKSGSITLAISLQKGLYVLHAEASLPTGERGTTTIRVEAIQGYLIGEMHFGSPHYRFHIAEKSAKGSLVGALELRSASVDVAPQIVSVDPANMNGYFYLNSTKVNDVVNIEVFVNETFDRVNSGPRVVLDIAASLTRAVELSTVAEIGIDDVNEAPFFKTSQSFVIGYPERTYFDPAVSMPIFTFQASDHDEGDNAILSYYLNEESRKDFDIDANNGQLFVKGLDSFTFAEKSLTVTVKDLSGDSSSLQVKLRSLKIDEIHVIDATGPETLSDEQITSDLSRALGYDVTVLHKVKDLRTRTRQMEAVDYDYTITVYAVKQGNFVDQAQFVNDLTANADGITGWIISTETIAQPESYKPDKLTNSVEAYTIATAVLASVLGLIFLSIAVYLALLFRNDKQMPWSAFRNSRTGTIDNKEKGSDLENTYTRASDSTDSQSNYLSLRTIEGESRVYSEYVTAAPPRTPATKLDDLAYQSAANTEEIYSPDIPKPQKSSLELDGNQDEVYCPPTPTPKKSILKDKDNDKVVEKAGVSFDPTPEVIKLAPTLSGDENEKADSSSDESEDGVVSIL